MTPACPSGRAPRRDGLANRERVLKAAAVEVRAHGDKVPLADIASRAGVGIGTLYRHFPTREALMGALTLRAFSSVLARAEALADRPGPAIDAIGSFFYDTIKHRDDLALPLHGGPTPLDAEATRLQGEIRTAIGRLITRGRAEGNVRDDVTARDIIIAAAQLAQPLAQVGQWDRVARRQARILLAGLAPEGGGEVSRAPARTPRRRRSREPTAG